MILNINVRIGRGQTMVVDCRVAVFGDWLPEARSWTSALQLCCSTQLESPYAAALSCSVATPPTHTSGALVCGSVGGFTCHGCLSQHKDAEKDIRPVSTYARSHTSATFSDIMSSESHFCLRSLSRCSSLLIPALLLTHKYSDCSCHCCSDRKHTGI